MLCSWLVFWLSWKIYCRGAIFLSKVTRVSSFAQVSFSDPILIRYGSGVGGTIEEEEDDDDDDSVGNKEKKTPASGKSNIPIPVLEFRVVNRLSHHKKGEIIDAGPAVRNEVLFSHHENKSLLKLFLFLSAQSTFIKDVENLTR